MESKPSKMIIAAAIVLILVVAGGLVAFTQLNKSDMPASFDMRDNYVVTPVKNQGIYGTCWAFGITGALESEILLANGGSEMVFISPMYIAETVYDSTEYNKYLDQDQVVFTSSQSMGYTGGNFTLAVYPMASGRAMTTEIVAPYHDMEEYGDRSAMADVDSYLVVSGIECLNAYTDAGAIKKHLLNGEAGAFIYKAEQNLNAYGLTTCDNSTNMDCDYSNHMVTLMGWDDNFSKDNFNVKPANNGAWLVKNSWGTGDTMKDGYQWISYDCVIGGIIFYSSVEIQDGYTVQYSYDNGYAVKNDLGLRDKASMANVFKADSSQTLTGTSFITMDNTYNPLGEKYTASVYSLGSGFSDPTDGTLLCSVSGTVTTNGLYYVDLGVGVHLDKGQLFSVVIDLEKKNGTVVVPLDVTEDGENHTSYSVSHAGESWLNSGNGWEDLSASGDTNIRIKAYAKVDVPVKAEIVSDNGKIIGSYSTFEDAVAAYSSGTIVLKSNINATGTLQVNKDLYFDLNGFEITFPATDGAVIEVTKSLHMKNGTIAVNGVGGIYAYADVDLANIAVKSLSTDKGVIYVALMVEGKDGSKPVVKLFDFYTDDYYDGDDYQSYRFGTIYLSNSKLEVSGSFIGPTYVESCTGSIIDTTALDIIATSCSITYKDVVLANKSELTVPGYVLTEYVKGTYTFGEPVAVDSNGTEYSNLFYAFKKGVGTVTLLRDVEHTVYSNDYNLAIANQVRPDGTVIPIDIKKVDLAGHSLKVLRGGAALMVGATITLDNSGKTATIESISTQTMGVIIISFGDLRIAGSGIVLKSDNLVPGVKLVFGKLSTEGALNHQEEVKNLGVVVTKTFVGDPEHVRSQYGYSYTVSGKSSDGRISYTGTCDPFMDMSSATGLMAFAGLDELYNLTGTYVSDGKVAVTLKEYYENGLRISKITEDGKDRYVISADKSLIDSNKKSIGSIKVSYSNSALTLTVYGLQNSHDIDISVWNAAIETIDNVSKIVGSDMRVTIVDVFSMHINKNVPADVVSKLFDRGAYIMFSATLDADSYSGVVPSWKWMINESKGNIVIVKPTQSLYGKALYCHVDALNGANSSPDIAKMVGGGRAWIVSLEADGKPVSLDGDAVKLYIPYKSGVQYYGLVDSSAVMLDSQKEILQNGEYSAISVKGMYVWESVRD